MKMSKDFKSLWGWNQLTSVARKTMTFHDIKGKGQGQVILNYKQANW